MSTKIYEVISCLSLLYAGSCLCDDLSNPSPIVFKFLSVINEDHGKRPIFRQHPKLFKGARVLVNNLDTLSDYMQGYTHVHA